MKKPITTVPPSVHAISSAKYGIPRQSPIFSDQSRLGSNWETLNSTTPFSTFLEGSPRIASYIKHLHLCTGEDRPDNTPLGVIALVRRLNKYKKRRSTLRLPQLFAILHFLPSLRSLHLSNLKLRSLHGLQEFRFDAFSDGLTLHRLSITDTELVSELGGLDLCTVGHLIQSFISIEHIVLRSVTRNLRKVVRHHDDDAEEYPSRPLSIFLVRSLHISDPQLSLAMRYMLGLVTTIENLRAIDVSNMRIYDTDALRTIVNHAASSLEGFPTLVASAMHQLVLRFADQSSDGSASGCGVRC